MKIVSIGLDRRSLEELFEDLKGLGIQEVIDLRTDDELRETGPFREQNLAWALRERGFTYLTLGGILDRSPGGESGRTPRQALDIALAVVRDQAAKYRLALIGFGSDPDAVFGRATLMGRLLEEGLGVELFSRDGALVPVERKPPPIVFPPLEDLPDPEAVAPPPERRASMSISTGLTLLACGAAAMSILGPFFTSDDAPQYDEFTVSSLNPAVIYDQAGMPYRRLTSGAYVPMTEEEFNRMRQEQRDRETSSGGGSSSVFDYWDYRNEGRSHASGQTRSTSKVSLPRGGFGASSGLHASGAGQGSSVGGHTSGS